MLPLLWIVGRKREGKGEGRRKRKRDGIDSTNVDNDLVLGN